MFIRYLAASKCLFLLLDSFKNREDKEGISNVLVAFISSRAASILYIRY